MAINRPPGGEAWSVGYVGQRWPLGDGRTIVDERSEYSVHRLAIDGIKGAGVDVLVVDDDRVDDAVAGMGDTETVPVIAIGTDDRLTIDSDTLRTLDDHVVVGDDLSALVATLDKILTERWQNLGMAAEQFVATLFERAPAHLYVKDTEGRHVRHSQFYDAPEELLGRTDEEVYPHEGFARQAYEDDMRVVETGEPIIKKKSSIPATTTGRSRRRCR